MSRRTLTAAIVVVACGSSASAAHEPDALTVLRGADATMRAARSISFSARREGLGHLATRTPGVEGRALLERAADGSWRIAAQGTRTEPGTLDATSFRLAFDGDRVRFCNHDERTLLEGDADMLSAALMQDPSGYLVRWVMSWDAIIGEAIRDQDDDEDEIEDDADDDGDEEDEEDDADDDEDEDEDDEEDQDLEDDDEADDGDDDDGMAQQDDDWMTGTEIAYVGTAHADGVACDVVYVSPMDQEGYYYFWFGHDDHLLRRVEAFYLDDSGVGMAAVSLSGLRLNEPVSDGAFHLEPPSGYEVAPFQPPGGDSGAGGQASAPAVGDEAPDWTLTDSAGAQHSLAGLRGQVVVMDFWATWCPPCRAAMPGVQKIHERFQGRPVRVFGVNCWEDGDPAGYMKDNRFTYGLLLNGDHVAERYGVEGIPTFYVVGVDGRVIFSEVGYDEHGADKIIAAIDAHLKANGK